ncbi:MAG: hypothetical protein Q9191_001320 [Dirinaria sp. TL-2023a]
MIRPDHAGEAEDAASTTSIKAPSGDKSHSRRSFDNWKRKPLTQEASTKMNQILAACGKAGRDLSSLVALATTPGGLVDDEVRRIAWPVLLGFEPGVPGDIEAERRTAWRRLPRHKDEDQVELDVNRSFIYYPKGMYHRAIEQLSAVIIEVLREHPMLCYFQGFHDIAQVILLVLGADQAAEGVSHLSLLRIRDFMLPSMAPSLAHLHLLPAILSAADPQLCKHLSQTQPFFALAATLTLYAHEIQEYSDIARLLDFLLAHGAAVSVYFFAVIVLSRRDELFDIPADEPEMLHSVLSKLPKPLDLEALISKTVALVTQHPPEHLPYGAWAKISPYSVLKTTIGPIRRQTLRDGEQVFANQVMQLRRAELRQQAMNTIWEYRRPAGSVGLAIFVALLSFWLRREGLGISVFGQKQI